MNKDISLITVIFSSSRTWLNCWWWRLINTNQYLRTIYDGDGRPQLPDVTVEEIFFLYKWVMTSREHWKITGPLLNSSMGHFTVTWWKTLNIFNVMRFLHYCNNRNQPVKTHKNYDRSWKIRSLFDMLSGTYAKIYNPSELSKDT
jgi:hypothetical protein